MLLQEDEPSIVWLQLLQHCAQQPSCRAEARRILAQLAGQGSVAMWHHHQLLEQQQQRIDAQDRRITQQEQRISEQAQQLSDREQQVAEQAAQIAELQGQLQDMQRMMQQLQCKAPYAAQYCRSVAWLQSVRL